MKKFITTLILALLSVLCVLTFMACGDNESENKTDNTQQGESGNTETGDNGNKPDASDKDDNGETGEDNKPQIVYTVNEEEWKAALLELFDGKHSVTCKSVVNDDEDVWSGIYEFDCINKVEHSDFVYEQGEIEDYTWIENDGKVYAASKIEDMVSKQIVSNEYYEIVILENLWACGGYFLIDCKIYEKYGDFSYDENDKEYTLTSKTEEDSVNYILKFEDGKLVEFFVEVNEIYTYSYIYTYNKVVTVPENILNMPVTEE